MLTELPLRVVVDGSVETWTHTSIIAGFGIVATDFDNGSVSSNRGP